MPGQFEQSQFQIAPFWSSSSTDGFQSANESTNTILLYHRPCHSCIFPIEEFDHTFRCPSPQRRRWQTNIRNDLFKLYQCSNTDPVLANIVIEELFHCFRQTPQTPQFISPTYDGLIISQGEIRWSHLLLGRWPCEWAALQNDYLQRTNSIITSQNHGTFWLSSIIQLI
jgi:hypothetical protein